MVYVRDRRGVERVSGRLCCRSISGRLRVLTVTSQGVVVVVRVEGRHIE